MNHDNRVFGRLTVIREAARSAADKRRMLVRCTCGKECTVQLSNLLSGCSTSCGCLRTEITVERSTTHGMSGRGRRHPLHIVWTSMIDRCTNPSNNRYHDYGGRGITIDPTWLASFEAFYKDVQADWKPGLTIDRINNEKGYSKDNTRWSTLKQQGRNKRNNVIIDTPWGRITLVEASERSGILPSTIRKRQKLGWPPSRLFDPPR